MMAWTEGKLTLLNFVVDRVSCLTAFSMPSVAISQLFLTVSIKLRIRSGSSRDFIDNCLPFVRLMYSAWDTVWFCSSKKLRI